MTHSLPPSPQPNPVPLLETPNDLKILHSPISNLISFPEPAPSLCMSLSSPILPHCKKLMEVDTPGKDLIKDLTQMSEKVRGILRAITPDVKPITADPLPIILIHTSILDLPPLSPLPIPEVNMMLTGWMHVSIDYLSMQFTVRGILMQLGDVMQHLLFKGGIQGYRGPLMPAAPMADLYADLYLHIDGTMEKEKLVEDIGKIKLSNFQGLLVDQTCTPLRDADILHAGKLCVKRIAIEPSVLEHHSTDRIMELWEPSSGTQLP
ncbi:hypothetical protein BU17DRAFT_79607 [Hysterangium stoloniferum]|nr:hypothetical protein BU17DRAFT_79607 [Hysterangium stoloniferum]